MVGPTSQGKRTAGTPHDESLSRADPAVLVGNTPRLGQQRRQPAGVNANVSLRDLQAQGFGGGAPGQSLLQQLFILGAWV